MTATATAEPRPHPLAEPTPAPAGPPLRVVASRAELAAALAAVASVIPARTPKAVLQCIRLAVDGDTLVIDGTNLEQHAARVCRQVQIESAGAIAVPAEALNALVRELDADTLTLETSGEMLTVCDGGGKYTLYTMNPADLPPAPTPDADAASLTVRAADLRRLFDATAPAVYVSKVGQSNRYALAGHMLEGNGKRLRAAATDGRRLAIAEVPHKAKLPGVIVPASLVRVLGRFWPDDDDAEIEVRASANRVTFAGHDWTLSGNLIEGTFPPVDDVIPKGTDRRLTADRAALLSAVRRAALMTTEESKGIRCEFAKGKPATFSSRSPTRGTAAVPFDGGRWDGEPLTIGFNPSLLADGLNATDAAEVTLDFIAPNRPLLLTAPGYQFVLMPCNLTQ